MTDDRPASRSTKWFRDNRERVNQRRRELYAMNGDARRAYNRAYRKAHPEKQRASAQKWRKANRDKVNAGRQRWAERYPEKAKAQAIKTKLRIYGLTLEAYERLLASQGGGCAICGAAEGNQKGHRLFVDHDHKTGNVRGLLCGSCNSVLGYMEESVERLTAAIAYLERERCQILV